MPKLWWWFLGLLLGIVAVIVWPQIAGSQAGTQLSALQSMGRLFGGAFVVLIVWGLGLVVWWWGGVGAGLERLGTEPYPRFATLRAALAPGGAPWTAAAPFLALVGGLPARQRRAFEIDGLVSQGMDLAAAGAADAEIRASLDGALERVSTELRRPLALLWGLASVSPLIGLLGTVVGIWRAFKSINFGLLSSAAQVLAKIGPAIGQALVTTIAGLIIAIVVLAFHYYYRSALERSEVVMHRFFCEW